MLLVRAQSCDLDQNAREPDIAFDTVFRPYVAFTEEFPVAMGGVDTRIVVLQFTQL